MSGHPITPLPLSAALLPLLLSKLDILPNKIDQHILERLGLDPQHPLRLARIALDGEAFQRGVVGEQAALNGGGEVFCRDGFGVFPLCGFVSFGVRFSFRLSRGEERRGQGRYRSEDLRYTPLRPC